uniref:Uncharacterized protein n=1 Tax=Anguilla anguilla TaxID=7936 RepID=A0A0E9S6E1_ANGAN
MHLGEGGSGTSSRSFPNSLTCGLGSLNCIEF